MSLSQQRELAFLCNFPTKFKQLKVKRQHLENTVEFVEKEVQNLRLR